MPKALKVDRDEWRCEFPHTGLCSIGTTLLYPQGLDKSSADEDQVNLNTYQCCL